MKSVVIYLLVFLTSLLGLIVYTSLYFVPFIKDYPVFFNCITSGGIGGILYCLRAVYLNYCVKKSWDVQWEIWYIIRPIVSLLSGGISYVFLKAGLLILESSSKQDASHFAFYAFAFVAGLNVDKFIGKIEDFAHKTWGIEKSRAGSEKQTQ